MHTLRFLTRKTGTIKFSSDNFMLLSGGEWHRQMSGTLEGHSVGVPPAVQDKRHRAQADALVSVP